jgi:serine/threonine protein kinase
MSPEVFKKEPYDTTADIYSLGLILYQFLNNGRLPFFPDYPQEITHENQKEAFKRRMNGEKLPNLHHINPFLNALLMMACAFDHKDRLSDPTEMREALESIAKTLQS